MKALVDVQAVGYDPAVRRHNIFHINFVSLHVVNYEKLISLRQTQ
jgi:hypothetical protein